MFRQRSLDCPIPGRVILLCHALQIFYFACNALTVLQVWEKYLHDGAAGQALNQEQFISTLKKQVQDPALRETLAGPLPLFFSAIDANADGMIQKEEFELFFDIIGLDPKMAGATFQAIDTNHDGQLSMDEFVTAGVDFFTSEDESSPNKLFWGPMV